MKLHPLMMLLGILIMMIRYISFLYTFNNSTLISQSVITISFALIFLFLAILILLRIAWNTTNFRKITMGVIVITALLIVVEQYFIFLYQSVLMFNFWVTNLLMFVGLSYFSRFIRSKDMLLNYSLFFALSNSSAILQYMLISANKLSVIVTLTNLLLGIGIIVLISITLFSSIWQSSDFHEVEDSLIRPKPQHFYIIILLLYAIYLILTATHTNYLIFNVIQQNHVQYYVLQAQYAGGLWVAVLFTLLPINYKYQLLAGGSMLLYSLQLFVTPIEPLTYYLMGLSVNLTFTAVLTLLISATGYTQEYAVIFNVLLVSIFTTAIGSNLGAVIAFSGIAYSYIQWTITFSLLICAILLFFIPLKTSAREDAKIKYTDIDLYPNSMDA